MRPSLLCAALLAAALAFASCSVATARNSYLSSHWHVSSSPAPAASLHRLNLGLAHQSAGVKSLKDFVSRVSDPASEEYAQYKTQQELRALLAPSDSTIAQLERELLAAGAIEVDVSLSGDFMSVLLPASAVSALFETEAGKDAILHVHTHAHSRRPLLRVAGHGSGSPRFRSPLLRKHVQLVTGLTDFPDYPKERRMAKRAAKRTFRKRALTAASASAKKHAKKHVSAASKAQQTCSNSAPDFGRLRSSQEDVSMSLIVYCSNGAATLDPVNLCSDNAPEVESFTLATSSRGTGVASYVYQAKELTCKLNAAAGEVFCTLPTLSFDPWRHLKFAASTTFADGSVSPTTTYGAGLSPSSYVTPNSIFARYGVPLGTRGTNPSNSQAVVAFEEQYIDLDTDYPAFLREMGISSQVPTIVGQNDPTQPGGESTLDIQYITGVAQGVPSYFLSFTGAGPAKPPGDGAYVLDWAFWVGNQTAPPLVTSISYGDTEDGYYTKFGSYVYIERMEVELAKMAARGLTVLAGSGDAGVSNVGEEGNDISDTDPTCAPFRAFYPSNSPYVTSVSSTFFTKAYLPICLESLPLPNSDSMLPILCDQIGEAAVGVSQGIFWTTGGGFSNRSDNLIASWQAAAVQSFLSNPQNPLPAASMFNAAGRAYPDMGGLITTVDGTSASGPVMAGLVSLLNEARLNAGYAPLGLINPFLYQAASNVSASFFDVVVGTNKDGDIQPKCGAYPTFCQDGFTAQPGWDPVTGLGTPNWAILKQLALAAAKSSVRSL